MADKFLKIGTSGRPAQQEGLVTSAGAADAGKIPALDSNGKLSETLLPEGSGPDARVFVASEDITAPAMVNIFNDGGTIKVRKADASNGRQADGYIKASVLTSASVVVYADGVSTGWTGLTLGSVYFLSASVPGGVTATPATSGSNHILQQVGKAVSTTEVQFEVGEVVELIA